MNSNTRKATLAASVAFIALLTAACGNDNANFNPPDNSNSTTTTTGGGTGGIATGGGTTTGGTTSGGNTSQLTGGFTGLTASIPTGFTASPTPATLTATNQLAATSSTQTGGNLAVTELVGPLSLNGSFYTMAVQGYGLTNQGSLTFVPQVPDSTGLGAGNIVITGDTSNTAVKVTDPYAAILGTDGAIYVTDQVRSANQGRLLRVSNVTTGGATVTPLATTLNNPISLAMRGNVVYVAQYVPQGAGGQGGGGAVRAIDVTTGTVTDFVTNLQQPSSIVIDQGKNLMYIAENGNGASSGAQGGVLRIDLGTFVAGTAFNGTTPSTGVSIVPVTAGDTATYLNPFDLAIDGAGNVVVSDGLTLNWSQASVNNAQITQGNIRMIAAGATTSKLILTGFTAARGLSAFTEGNDTTGPVTTAFFTEGSPGAQNSTVRELMFRSDGAVYRNLQIDNGQFSPLGTAYDPGTQTGGIRSLKYGIGFLTGTQGQIRDLR